MNNLHSTASIAVIVIASPYFMYYSQKLFLGHLGAFWVTYGSAGETILVKYTSSNSSFQYEQFDVLFSKYIFGSRGGFLGHIRVKGSKDFGKIYIIEFLFPIRTL